MSAAATRSSSNMLAAFIKWIKYSIFYAVLFKQVRDRFDDQFSSFSFARWMNTLIISVIFLLISLLMSVSPARPARK